MVVYGPLRLEVRMQFDGMSNEHLVAELIEKHGHVFRRGGREADNLFFQVGLVYCRPDAAPEFREYYTREATKLMPADTARRVLEKEAKRREPPTAMKGVGVVCRRDQMDKRRQPWWRMFRIW
jgi:hypothetical protein